MRAGAAPAGQQLVTTRVDALPNEAEVLVVGAGLAGLAAAVALQKAGLKPLVLESSDGVGGRVRTDKVRPRHPTLTPPSLFSPSH